MKYRKANAQIINAIVWAAIILASAWLASDSERAELLMFAGIAGWLVTQRLTACSGSNRNSGEGTTHRTTG